MYRLKARDMLRYTTPELYDLLTGEFELEFDDGVIQTNEIMTAFSSWAWKFHRQYPNTPLLTRHHVQTQLNGKRYSASTHLDLLGAALDDAYETYKATEPSGFRDRLAELLCRVRDDIYNDSTYRFEADVGSADIVNFIEILDQPEIVQYKAERDATPAGIERAYKTIDEVLLDPNRLQHNPVALAYRSRLVRDGQIKQSIGPVGFRTDTDSMQFEYPVMRGFVEGLRSMYDSIIESRSASKALQFSKDNLRKAEYFSRKLQLACMNVRNLHHGDCGSTRYVLWKVSGPQHDEQGRQTYGGDLPLIVGKLYMDDDGVLKAVKASDKHLIGKRIKMRSVFHCAHPDPVGICSACFGELSLQVPEHSNIGHICCVTMTEPSSQSVLSVKHEDSSAVIEPVAIRLEDAKFLKPSRDRQSYILMDRLARLQPQLIVAAPDASSLSDILAVERIEDFNLSRISELEEVIIQYQEGGQLHQHRAVVRQGGRKSMLTYAMLHHIRAKGWTHDANGNYVIDMGDWDYTKPILTLPLRHFNMSDHSKEIATLLQATKDQMEARDKDVTPTAFLEEFFTLVNNKLKVNIAPLEVILYSLMIVSAERCDYRLPKPWDYDSQPDGKPGVGVYTELMANRSLAGMMAFQSQYGAIVSPESMVNTGRLPHLFDGLFMTGELFNQGGPLQHSR